MNWFTALVAAGAMVITDVLGVVMVMAEARNRGWMAGWCDTAQWIVTKAGQVIGARFVTDQTSIADRVLALERTITDKGHS